MHQYFALFILAAFQTTLLCSENNLIKPLSQKQKYAAAKKASRDARRNNHAYPLINNNPAKRVLIFDKEDNLEPINQLDLLMAIMLKEQAVSLEKKRRERAAAQEVAQQLNQLHLNEQNDLNLEKLDLNK